MGGRKEKRAEAGLGGPECTLRSFFIFRAAATPPECVASLYNHSRTPPTQPPPYSLLPTPHWHLPLTSAFSMAFSVSSLLILICLALLLLCLLLDQVRWLDAEWPAPVLELHGASPGGRLETRHHAPPPVQLGLGLEAVQLHASTDGDCWWRWRRSWYRGCLLFTLHSLHAFNQCTCFLTALRLCCAEQFEGL